MSVTLTEALRGVDLDFYPGQTFRCEGRGKLIEVRVLDRTGAGSGIDESDVMLEPWVDLPAPRPEAGLIVRMRPDARLPVDVPEIPLDEATP